METSRWKNLRAPSPQNHWAFRSACCSWPEKDYKGFPLGRCLVRQYFFLKICPQILLSHDIQVNNQVSQLLKFPDWYNTVVRIQRKPTCVLVLYCCCNKLPQICEIYFLYFHRSKIWHKSQLWQGCVPFWSLSGGIPFLASSLLLESFMYQGSWPCPPS